MNASPTAPEPVRLVLADDLTLVYTCGTEYDPSDPFGRSTLTLHADGRLRLDNRARGAARGWTAVVGSDTVERLVALLNAAGFPVVPTRPIAPGSTRTLLVQSRGQEFRSPLIGFHEVERMPEYRQVFHLLDSLIVGASQETLTMVHGPQTGLVQAATTAPPPDAAGRPPS